MSYTWNPIICRLCRLVSSQNNMYLEFLHIFSWLESSGWQALIRRLCRHWLQGSVGTDQLAERCYSRGWVGDFQSAERKVVKRWWSCWQAFNKRLTIADQLADRGNQATDRRWSSGWQVLIKWLTGADQAADSHWSSGCLEQIAWLSRHRSRGWGDDHAAE